MSAWSDEVRRGLAEWLARVAAKAGRQCPSPQDYSRAMRAARAHYEEWHPQPAGPHTLEVTQFLTALVREWRARGLVKGDPS